MGEPVYDPVDPFFKADVECGLLPELGTDSSVAIRKIASRPHHHPAVAAVTRQLVDGLKQAFCCNKLNSLYFAEFVLE